MEKIKITVCCGTTCYVLGNYEILEWKNSLDKQLKEQVCLKGSACLGRCREVGKGRPPFIYVNDELICEANLEKLLTKIKQLQTEAASGK